MSSINSTLRRNSATIALAAILAIAGTILYVQALATSQLQHEVEGQQQIIQQVKDISLQLNRRGEERTKQFNEVNQHLDCIVAFFAQKDRSQKAIADVHTCMIKPVSQVTAPVVVPAPAASAAPVHATTPTPYMTPTPSRPPAAVSFTDRAILAPFAKLLGLF